jgi:hypothetical protein
VAVAAVLAVVALISAILMLCGGIPASPAAGWGVLGTAVALAAAAGGLQRFSRLFTIYEFEHAGND